MKCVDDFRLTFDKKEYVPIMIGGMGVDISTSDLSLTAARLGGIGHISDAMVPTVSDRRYDTKYVRDKLKSTSTTSPTKTNRTCSSTSRCSKRRSVHTSRQPWRASRAVG